MRHDSTKDAQRKQAELQWVQDPSKIYGDNLKNVSRKFNRHFRNRNMECMKEN
jgi:hypothetical protein